MRYLVLVVGFFVSSLAYSASPYSPSEGYLDRGHDPALARYRQKYFYSASGKLDPSKLQALVGFLEFQKSLLLDSAKMNRKTNLILVHGYDNDEAENEGVQALDSEAETIAPFIFALEHVRNLQAHYASMSPLETHEKVELILLFIGAGYTPYPMTIFTSMTERFKNLAENFFEFKIDDSQMVHASNLLLRGKFATQAELRAYRQAGGDLSKIDPPSSPIWTDSEVESYDPYVEVYWNQKFFPPRDIQLPVFHYERMGNGTVKFKTHWFDDHELNKKLRPKKKDVTLRVGWEAYTASVVNHLARIVGYPANPTTFRAAIKLELHDVGYEEFLSQWRRVHGLEMGTAMTHVERLPGENAVILKNVTLEAYPDKEDYRKMGPFRMGDNGLRNRREYRAMVLYNALISLQDQFEYQARVDAIRDSKRGWLPLFFISDTSSALGLPAMLGNVGTVNEYTWEFTQRSERQISLFWFSVFNSRTWKDTTYSDVKWLARRMGRIRTGQIDGILQTSGFPEPVQRLYAEKIKSRLNKMILDFDLLKEGYALHAVASKEELAKAYPGYINSDGLLSEGAQEYPGNTLPILGERFTPFQGAIANALKTLRNRLVSKINPLDEAAGNFTIDLGRTSSWGGLAFDASRGVSVNPELGPGQKRYLLTDVFSVSLPVGLFNSKIATPIGLYYTYTFEYTHSVSTLREVATNQFFSLLNPFSLHEIRRNLGMGEQLHVTHSFGASIGKTKFKAIDDIQIEAALLGLNFATVKSVYFAKPHPTLLEVNTDYFSIRGAQTGLDIRTYLRLAATLRKDRSQRIYRLYRIDLLNQSEGDQYRLQEAFDAALIDNDFTSLETMVKPHEIRESNKNRYLNLSLFLWNTSSDLTVGDLALDGNNLVIARKAVTSDRSIKRTWDGKVDGRGAKDVVNFLGEFWSEGKYSNISFEGLVSPDGKIFSEVDVTITLSRYDNNCTRNEFGEFKEFFNERAGVKRYIRFEMPEELTAYPELAGTMRWQISKRALYDILTAATRLSFPILGEGGQDPRIEVVNRAAKILNAWSREVIVNGRVYGLKDQARDMVFVLDQLIGRQGQNIARLRKFTRDENIWLTTRIANMLELSHPTFRSVKQNDFWAPEIGRFQGHSFVNRFRRQNLLEPILRQ